MPRKSAESLYEERKRLWEKIEELEANILRGSVVILRRPCTYPGSPRTIGVKALKPSSALVLDPIFS